MIQIPSSLPLSIKRPLVLAQTHSELKAQIERLIRKGVDAKSLETLKSMLEVLNEAQDSHQPS
jgi:methionine synthase I (cobalamin-dependent)